MFFFSVNKNEFCLVEHSVYILLFQLKLVFLFTPFIARIAVAHVRISVEIALR